MKKFITPSLLKFAVSVAALTIIFRLFLDYGVDIQSKIIISLSAIIYFIVMLALGFYFGYKDGQFLPIYDVGFRFHLTTYIVFISISELWYFLGFREENSIHKTALIWVIFLFLHFLLFLIMRKKSFKGLHKEELFD